MIPGLLVLLLCLFPSGALASSPSEENLPSYHLKVSFDIQASRIVGEAAIQVPRERELKIGKADLQILELSVKGVPIDIRPDRSSYTIKLNPGETAKIRYTGTFRGGQGSGSFGAADRPRIPSRVIGEKGIFLSGAWYPQIPGLCRYRLTAALPEGYEAVSEAEEIEAQGIDGNREFTFSFPHPLENLTLAAGRNFRVARDHQQGTAIYAYFFPEDESLAGTYIEAAKKYLTLYGRLLGKYPYKRFSIVENFLPTGYSMPTYTLLGQGVVRLPFILDTSLGHEILHQWFGNLVYVDYEGGNWAEGLTTYLADHFYEEEKGRGNEYRKGALVDYRSYVNAGNEVSLKNFRGRDNRSSQAIGYGKALMVFHMLKNLVGETAFFDSLRAFLDQKRFQNAGWQDLRGAFEKTSNRELGWFFHQWVDGKGLADFDLGEVRVRHRGGKFEVSLEIRQKGGTYRVDLPVSFHSGSGRVRRVLSVETEKSIHPVLLDQYPRRVVVDGDYDVARTLSAGEFPPVIARLLNDEKILLVPPPSGEEAYRPAVDHFKRMGGRVEQAGQVKDEEIKRSTVVILDSGNPLAERLYGRAEAEGGVSLAVKENPWNPEKVVAVIQARSGEEAAAAWPKIVHYGKFSFVSFNQGENAARKTEETARGMVKELRRDTSAVEVSALETLADIIPRVVDKKILYVGESHDRFSHHLAQLEIIQALHRAGKKVAIGMEMFQRPFQGALDDYIAGRIDERAFLKRSEYFQRWKFDYRLYQPILQFARAERIPVVALNLQREITEKVGKTGLDSLSEEEKKLIPSQVDFSDRSYRERLEKVFREHPSFEARNFDFFLQAQILWDETMAESADRFLKKNPDYQMVVLAGSGHLAYGSGIPQRAARRNGFAHSILLNEAEWEKDIAHFILHPAPVLLEGTPRLMITLADEKGPPVIQGFSPGSVSEKAGLQKGDRILALDQNPVESYEDLRIELLSKRKGDRVKVKVARKDSKQAEQGVEYEVMLE